MSFIMAGAAIVSAGVGIYKAISGAKAKKEAAKKAAAAKAEMDRQKAKYSALDTSNPYADYENQMAENVYEDVTVNQQQAEFQRSQQEQQRANIMQNLQGAAGGSGIAALAQTLANQGSLEARQTAVSIGQQEAANQKLQAQGELIVQKGEQAAQAKRFEGEVMSRDMERQKIMTLMGMSQSEQAAHNQAAAAGEAQMWEGVGDVAGAATTYAGGKNPKGGVCFAKGSDVEMFDGTIKAIELIKVGDEVKSIKDNKVVKGIVTNTIIHPTNDVVEVVKINGITAEPKHPVYVNNKWILIGELETTTTHQFIDNWYNLEVDGNVGSSEHNYIIGNLVASGSYPSRTKSIVSARERVIKKKFKQI